MTNTLTFLYSKEVKYLITMTKDTAQKAVSAALSGNWDEAITLNNSILDENPKDVGALNRLAKAYAEKGNFSKARTTAKRVLKIDPLNSIAKKSVTKWKELKNTNYKAGNAPSAQTFLEEPGKTKIVRLLHPGDKEIMASLNSGDEVVLELNGRRVSVNTKGGKYIGRLADDLSAKLKELTKHGNEYCVYIKRVDPEDKENVTVFIRETKRASKLSDIPSFTSEKVEYISFS